MRWAVLLLAVSSACATAGAGGSAPAPAAAGGLVGTAAPDLTVRALEGGQEIRLSSLRGKVVLLDIWASWCAPCKEELPMLDDIAARLKARGVEVLAVSVDEEREAALGFLRTRPRWSVTFAHDPEKVVAERLQPDKMPTSYVIDANGVVQLVNSGFEPQDAARIEAKLLELAGK